MDDIAIADDQTMVREGLAALLGMATQTSRSSPNARAVTRCQQFVTGLLRWRCSTSICPA